MAIIAIINAIPVAKIVLNAVEFPNVATTIGWPFIVFTMGGVGGIMVVARTGPMAPPRFLSIVFIPNPTAVFSLGTEIEIMFTIGMIIETTPTSETATSTVSSVVVPSINVNSSKTNDAD